VFGYQALFGGGGHVYPTPLGIKRENKNKKGAFHFFETPPTDPLSLSLFKEENFGHATTTLQKATQVFT